MPSINPADFNADGQFSRTITSQEGITVTQSFRTITSEEGFTIQVPLQFDIDEIKSQAQDDGQSQKEQVPIPAEDVHSTDRVIDEQLGELISPEPVGNHSTSNLNAAFNNGVNIAFNFFGIANSIRNNTRNQTPPPPDQIILNEEEKEFLESKARSFSAIGIVPYDVIEDFLYVLIAIDSYSDLQFIARITGIIELDNPNFIRQPLQILSVPELFRISYISNGLASLTRQIEERLSRANEAARSSESSYSNITNPQSSSSPSFTALQPIIQTGLSIASLITSTKGITNPFGTGSIPNFLEQIETLPGVINNLVETANNFEGILQNLQRLNIAQLRPTLDKITDVIAKVRLVKRFSDQLNIIDALGDDDNIVTDTKDQLDDINKRVTDIQSKIQEVLTEFTSAIPNANVGQTAENLTEREGGMWIGNLLSRLVLGQEIPTQIASNNPLLEGPSYIGRAFFGEHSISLPAVDQLFPKRVAFFSDPQSSSGTTSFKFQNFGSFGGPQTLQNVVSNIIGGNVSGAVSVAAAGFLDNFIGNKANDIGNLLGAAVDSTIDLRRSDNAIPLMIGMASVLANDTKSPFPTSVFSEGWRLASSVGNIIQDRNPEFINTLRTNL